MVFTDKLSLFGGIYVSFYHGGVFKFGLNLHGGLQRWPKNSPVHTHLSGCCSNASVTKRNTLICFMIFLVDGMVIQFMCFYLFIYLFILF